MVYATFAEVRPLVGNILSTEFADADITTECLAADSWINTKTQKSDWDSGDVQHNLIVKVANKKAAEFVLEHYGPEYNDKINMLREECAALIADIVDNMPVEDVEGLDESIIVVTSNYASYPLSLEDDSDATPYISTEEDYTI